MKRVCAFAVAFAVLAVTILQTWSPHAAAAPSANTITVDSTLDEPDNSVIDGQCISTPSGKCTLRAAVKQANLFTVDTTIFVPAGTYTLTIGPIGQDGPETGDLNLTAPSVGNPAISIVRAGAGSIIIDGHGTDRVFYIDAGRTASISDVTIRNGLAAAAGGGINNAGTATLSNVTVRGQLGEPRGRHLQRHRDADPERQHRLWQHGGQRRRRHPTTTVR